MFIVSTPGERLHEIRLYKKKSLEEVSTAVTELLNRGITDPELKKQLSKQTLFKYENNIVTNIPNNTIECLAKYYNVEPAYILGWLKGDLVSFIREYISHNPKKCYLEFSDETDESQYFLTDTDHKLPIVFGKPLDYVDFLEIVDPKGPEMSALIKRLSKVLDIEEEMLTEVVMNSRRNFTVHNGKYRITVPPAPPKIAKHLSNPETAKLVQELYENKDLRILLDASRKLKPEDIKALNVIIKSMKGDDTDE